VPTRLARFRRRFASLHVRRAVTHDGREWEIHIQRFQWRKPGEKYHDPVSDEGLAFLDEIVEVAWAAVTFPAAIVRSVRTRYRRVEAICWWPNEARMVWETDAAHVDAVAEELTRQLERGYEHVAPANATFLGFTDPPAGPD
jgi:hypothetical protein